MERLMLDETMLEPRATVRLLAEGVYTLEELQRLLNRRPEDLD